MNKQKVFFILLCIVITFGSEKIYSQGFMQKLKDQAKEKVTTGNNNTSSPNNSNPSSTSNSNSKSVQNTKGNGLVNSPPNVLENIKSAKTAFGAKNYSDARYSARQALLGVEMEMGQNVLKSLPDKADGMPNLPDEDKVNSSGTSFAGVTIQRIYQANDKQLKILVDNGSFQSSVINMSMNNQSYVSSNNNQNSKQVKVKGYNGLLQFNQNSGYSLSVPLGQTSSVIINGINYSDENTFISAANQFDFDKIKNELGEK